jgi:hypothetical protein
VRTATTDPTLSNNWGRSNNTIIFNPPPTITDVGVSKPVLWPPNHKMVDETVDYVAMNSCGCYLSVESNEPENGSEDTGADWEIVDPHHVRLRAERAGNGNGRIYTISIICYGGGGVTTRTVTVSVPKKQP